MGRLIEPRVRNRESVPSSWRGKLEHWARPEALDASFDPNEELVHIPSPFEPLVHQRERLRLFFDYEHRFEAYRFEHIQLAR
jgi:uncharacterized protein YcaQ